VVKESGLSAEELTKCNLMDDLIEAKHTIEK
jgi:hypothetical protein